MANINYESLQYDEIENLKKSLLKAKLITKYDKEKLEEVQFDKTTVNELINKPKLIQFNADDDRVFVETMVNNKLEVVYLDTFETSGIEATADFICDFLPEFTFPVIYPNNLRGQKEMQAVYKLVVIIYSLDLEIKRFFEDVLNHYDFQTYKHRNERALYTDFSSILEKLSSDNTLVVKSLISACNYKISDYKKKLSPSFISELSSREIIELSGLKLERANIFIEYQTKERETKITWEKAKIRSERDNAIEELIRKYKHVGQIFKALKLNSECLSQMDKDKIRDIGLTECQKFYKISAYEAPSATEVQDFNSRLRTYLRVCSQLVIDKYKMDAITSILADNNYVVIRKR